VSFYANLLVRAVSPEVVAYLNDLHVAAYVVGSPAGDTLICHEDFDTQERLAASVSAHFQCPVLLTMAFADTVLLYHLYVNGEQADAYVSTPHDGLELDGPVPEGNAEVLCAAFDVEQRVPSVERVLRRPTKPGTDYALAMNRHGELFRALKLPLFAAGASFASIEAGELPYGQGFDAAALVRTGR
jgi:hypothetical protein